MKKMTNLCGIDVGLTLLDDTSGVCRTGAGGFRLGHAFTDKLSRKQILGDEQFDVTAIDGPILPTGALHYGIRPVEKVFIWGSFHNRCKPGDTSVRGTGQALRRGGCDTAVQLEADTLINSSPVDFPRVQAGRNLIEAFPNGFLGVLLNDDVYGTMPDLERNEKLDWLLQETRTHAVFQQLKRVLDWSDEQFWSAVEKNQQHDEQAALICALSAVCVWNGSYVAVGERIGGYFFLPPWNCWQDWAKSALNTNRRDRRLRRELNLDVDVWINGRLYAQHEDLP